MKIIGYARVSTADQSLGLQRDALKNARCSKIFEDHGASGATQDRDGLIEALEALEPGDTLMVWRLDRLARSMRDLTDMVVGLHGRDIAFRSLCEQIDISSAFGEFVLHILSAVAHFERALIVERTKAGIEAARARGVQIGRRPAIDGDMLCEALFLLRSGFDVSQAATQIGVGRSTLYRHLSALARDE